jgi:hypothetical protein
MNSFSTTFKTTIGAVLAMLLSGCLEVEQHPAWADGQYAGKPDNRSSQVSFHNDKLAWNAAISNRNQHQNEYNRAKP